MWVPLDWLFPTEPNYAAYFPTSPNSSTWFYLHRNKKWHPNSIQITQGENNNDVDREIWTKDGSLDYYGRPAQRANSGGWRSGILLLANQTLITLAFVGVEVNLVLFCKRVLNQDNATASTTFSAWIGTVNMFSLFGAFLSDAYLGRYKSCAIFQTILTVGMIILAVTAPSQLLKPAGCGITNFPCGPHPDSALTMFYLSIYLIAFGNGAGGPSIVTFGTDQFDEEHHIESESKKFYYSYFYVATNLGYLFSETVLSYLENSGHWALGLEISAFIAVVSLVVFFCGTARYRYFRLQHMNECRLLDQAAMITSEEIIASLNQSNSNICTITQVEKTKYVLRVLPIWLCALTFNGLFIHLVSLYVEQGSSMKTSIKNFHIPPASMSIFDILFSSLYIVLYNSCIKPLYIEIFKTTPKVPSQLKKTCYGLILAMMSMVVAGFVEIQRKRYAQNNEDELSSLFILWQVPQYLILGFGEALVYVSLNEFFDSQMPDVMKSMGIALSLSSNAVGSYICSLILTVMMKITTKNGGQGWIPTNLNDGFLENYFFLMTILSAFELVLFAIVARSYKPIMMEDIEERLTARHLCQ